MDDKNIYTLPNNDSTKHKDAPLEISNCNQIEIEDDQLVDNYMINYGLETQTNKGSNPRKNGKWSLEEVR